MQVLPGPGRCQEWGSGVWLMLNRTGGVGLIGKMQMGLKRRRVCVAGGEQDREVRSWHRFSRKTVAASFLEMFKARLDRTWSNLR